MCLSSMVAPYPRSKYCVSPGLNCIFRRPFHCLSVFWVVLYRIALSLFEIPCLCTKYSLSTQRVGLVGVLCVKKMNPYLIYMFIPEK